jgi:hypothetical protein
VHKLKCHFYYRVPGFRRQAIYFRAVVSTDSGQCPVAYSGENDDETSDFIKAGNVFTNPVTVVFSVNILYV